MQFSVDKNEWKLKFPNPSNLLLIYGNANNVIKYKRYFNSLMTFPHKFQGRFTVI